MKVYDPCIDKFIEINKTIFDTYNSNSDFKTYVDKAADNRQMSKAQILSHKMTSNVCNYYKELENG